VKKPHVLLKLAAVVSAVLLVGGFVAYSAGAFSWILGNDPRPHQMGGSKRKEIFTPDTAPQSPSGEPNPAATLMGGSKSISVSPLVLPPVQVTPTTEAPPSSTPAKSPE
jgi:hypothetical protein